MKIRNMTARTKAGLMAATVVLLSVAGVGGAIAATAPVSGSQPAGTTVYGCVSATGHLDYFEYRGTLPHTCWLSGEHVWSLAAGVPGVAVNQDLKGVASVPTGGSFVANSTEVGTVSLKAGTYLVSVNAKATPTGSSTPVFPQFFVYDQAKNASWTGDLFNVGSGALAPGSTSLDSYYSGSEVVTLASDTVLHVYAFGYSPGGASGTYVLDDLAIAAVPVP